MRQHFGAMSYVQLVWQRQPILQRIYCERHKEIKKRGGVSTHVMSTVALTNQV